MEETLVFDPRLYDLMRQNAITTVEEALVELITNSHDAYISVENTPMGENYKGLPINVTSNDTDKTVKVLDQAKGMSTEDMRNKLLIVGSLTADDFTRGMIGRGAKDVTNICDVTFESIRDNKYTKLTIYQNLSVKFHHMDIFATNDHRLLTGITGNGMLVTMKIASFVSLPSKETLIRRMRNNIYLRKIYQESNHPVHINGKRMIYTEPPGEEILNVTFEVPNYPEAKAAFILYKSDQIIPNPETDMEMKYGILVRSSVAVYECGGLYIHNNEATKDMRYNPLIKRIRGELICDHIDKLAKDISTVGQTIKNPFLIFDPNRRNGLNKKHPFTEALFKIPHNWLEIVLNKMQDEIDENLITPEDITQLFSGISSMLEDSLPFEKTLYTWRSKTDQENLDSMRGMIRDIKINKNILDLDDEIIDQLKTGENMYPVKTVDPNTRMRFDIKLSNRDDMIKPYEVYFYSDKISIRINSNNASVGTFVDVNGDGIVDVPSEGGMVAINKVLEDAIVYIMTRQKIMSSNFATRSDTDNYNEILEIQAMAHQDLSSFAKPIYQSIRNKFANI